MPARKFDVSQFKVISFLGEGAFGQVCLVEDKQNKSEDNKFALKVLEKKLIKANYSEEYVRREIEIQSHLIHRTIVRCFGYFHDEVNVYIVLEHLERSIYDELQRQPYNRFTEKRSARIMWYVADALSFLHERDVLHRDIKPANLLLHRDGTVKLGDFGLAVILRGEKRRTICGSVPYLAPEIKRSEPYTKYVDIWSMGILCHELLTGKQPKKRNEMSISISVPKQAKQLIVALTNIRPEKRLSAAETKQHPWIQSKMN